MKFKALRNITGLFIIFAMVLTVGCSSGKEVKNGTYLYVGESDSWLATYTISEAKGSYYDSLTIQYIFEENKGPSENEKIGPIEFQLKSAFAEVKSTYPQELQGVANFHTGSRASISMGKPDFNKDGELTVTWQGKSETLTLKKQN